MDPEEKDPGENPGQPDELKSQDSSEHPQFPKRPGFGTHGKEIDIITNNFSVKLPSGNIYHYDVEIQNKLLSMKRCRKVINKMLETEILFRNVIAVYDGRKNLYTRNSLNIDSCLSCKVIFQEDGDVDLRESSATEYNVFVKPVRRQSTNDNVINLDTSIHAFYKNEANKVSKDALTALMTVLRQSSHDKFSIVGRSFFCKPDERDSRLLGDGKEIWFGYHQSLHLDRWKPLLNLDITSTTFWQSKNLIEHVVDLLNFKDSAELKNLKTMRDSDIRYLSNRLKNVCIETTHVKAGKRKYRILEFTLEPANELTFTYRDKRGNESLVTIEQYFKKHYGLQLQFPQLCCVRVNPSVKNINLPMELCSIVGRQHCRLDKEQAAELIKFSTFSPAEHFKKIENHAANFDQDMFLEEFGFEVSTKPLLLTSRVIDAPNLRYTGRNKKIKIKPKGGQWNMRDLNYFTGAKIGKWVLLSFSDPGFLNEEMLTRFAQLLVKIAKRQGISINVPEHIHIANKRKGVRIALEDIQKFGADLIVVVVPLKDNEIHGQIKIAAELNIGVVTQCIKDTNVKFNCNPVWMSYLCQKINTKTGGVNISLTPGEIPHILRRPVIIFGACVDHPVSWTTSKHSIEALVGSLDSHPFRYAATVRVCSAENKEIISNLEDMVLELLKEFYRATKGVKPETIVLYRGGVGDGYLENVRDEEVRAIRRACESLSPDYKPGITMISVQKSHHTRFMTHNDRDGVGKFKNIPPGIVVDNDITHRLNFDFFLCSHLGLQGTSRPCHYTVIWDDNDFSADELQKLSYYLCHTYARCTQSISVPPPILYAHLAASRAKEHYDGQLSNSNNCWNMEFNSVELSDDAVTVVNSLKNTMYFV